MTVISSIIKSVIASLVVNVSDKALSFEVKPSTPSSAVILIVGTELSITMALFAPKDPLVPGLARVRVAAFPSASLIVPPFKVKELVAT